METSVALLASKTGDFTINNILISNTSFFTYFRDEFYQAFIEKQRYLQYFEGVKNTLILSILACIIGVLIGVLLTAMRMSKKKILTIPAGIYIDIMRATPVVTQILIIYFVILGKSGMDKILIGSIAFGLNSGAYVSEILRAGILSIDKGQTEAGRSLGFSKFQTMFYIIIPQAIKNVLPAIANEFIVLIKETAIAGYITILDITKAASGITGATYKYGFPLLGSAVLYYIIIKTLTICFNLLEKKLRQSDAR